MSLSQEQAEARMKGIGGSEAAVACGISPWKTPVQLWQEKRGEIKPPNLDDVELVQWGGLLEGVIADEWARRNQQTVHRVNDTKWSKAHPFMCANIDRRVVGKREGLEVKNASQWTNEAWGEVGSDDVPLYYLTQGIHYMHVMDYDAWNYAVLLGGNQLLSYRVERDSKIEQQVIEQEGRFWECVTTGRPPPALRVDDLVRLYPRTSGRVTATPEILALVMRYREIKAAIRPLDHESKKPDELGELQRIKLAVGKFMGEAGDLYDPVDVTLLHATYRANDETRVDSESVRKGKLKQMICEAMQLAAGSSAPTQMLSGADVATFHAKGPEALADLIVASMLRTSQVRKFLTK